MSKKIPENLSNTINIARDDALSKGAIAAALAIDMLVHRITSENPVFIINPENKDIPFSVFEDFAAARLGKAQ